MRSSSPPASTAKVRLLVQGVVAFGLVGSAVDLALTGHYESAWQLVPFAATGMSLAALGWYWFTAGGPSLLALRSAMIVLLAAGAAGCWLHYQGSREFQLETDPSMAGFTLWAKVLSATAPPVLAPMSMGLLGMFGLVSLHGVPAAPTRGRDDAE